MTGLTVIGKTRRRKLRTAKLHTDSLVALELFCVGQMEEGFERIM